MKNLRILPSNDFIARKTSIAGTEIDQRFDGIFDDFITKAYDVDARLQQLTANDLSVYRFTIDNTNCYELPTVNIRRNSLLPF